MSQETFEQRLISVEKEQASQGQQLASLSRDVGAIGSDVKQLLARDAGRPDGLTGPKIAATAITTLTLLGGLWLLVSGLVEHSPAVVELGKRMDQAEWKYGWAARVER